MNNNETMLSKEDYLAISKEYQAEKEVIRKKNRNIMIIGIVVIGFSLLILPFILIPMTIGYNAGLSLLGAIMITIVCVIIGAIIAGIGGSAMERKPKELGIQYYQRYVAEYNSKHQKSN